MSDTHIEPVSDGDVSAFIELYRTHLGTLAAELWDKDWFSWKFEANPNVSETAMVVAKDGDRVVGAAGFMPVEMAFRDASFVGVQPVDIVVHPDYRDAMLFNDLVESGLAAFTTDRTWLVYGQPREESLKVWTQLRQWGRLQTLPRSWRIHRIDDFIRDMLENDALGALSTLSQPAFWGYRTITDLKSRSGDPTVTVSEHDTVPVQQLSDLYRQTKPDGLHVVRNEQFYRWRLSQAPHAEYRTYLAEKDGTVVGGLVVSRWNSQSAVKIVDLLPAHPSASREVDIVCELVAAAIRANSDASGVRATPVLPDELIHRFGFDQTQQLQRLVSRAGVFDRFTGSLRWNIHLAGRVTETAQFSDAARSELMDWNSWRFTGIEIDTA